MSESLCLIIIMIVTIPTLITTTYGVMAYLFDYCTLKEMLFPLQYYVHKKYEDELNIVGMTILDIFVSFPTICGSILTLVVIAILKILGIFRIFREIFFVTFRKEANESD